MVRHKKQYVFLIRQLHNACPDKGARGKVKGVPGFGLQILSNGGPSFSRTKPEQEAAYRRVLQNAGFGTHKRYSGGGDVSAACGQLAAIP